MEVVRGINPNCSECALVVYTDELTEQKQRDFFNKFFKDKGLTVKTTPKGNLTIETGDEGNPDYKDGLWALRDAIYELGCFMGLGIKEDKHYGLIRDESYYDLIDEGEI
jgi:hypothetical protein